MVAFHHASTREEHGYPPETTPREGGSWKEHQKDTDNHRNSSSYFPDLLICLHDLLDSSLYKKRGRKDSREFSFQESLAIKSSHHCKIMFTQPALFASFSCLLSAVNCLQLEGQTTEGGCKVVALGHPTEMRRQNGRTGRGLGGWLKHRRSSSTDL